MSSDDEYEYNSPLLEPDCILHDEEEEEDSNSYKNSINNISNHSEFSVYPIPNKQQRIKPPEILATLRPPRIQLVVCDDEDDDSVVRAGNITLSNIGAQPPMNNNPLHYQARKITPLSKCPFCLKYFRRMRSHLKLHHDKAMSKSSVVNAAAVGAGGGGEGQIHTCTLCTKSFNSFSNLSIHMRTHTGDKPYICTFCDKAFAQSCNLVNHLRTHTGERPYKCPICLRGFTQSGNLNNHMRLHSDDKPFKCHSCSKAFTQSGNLNSHIRNNHRNNHF